ncbi:nematode resistance protein-like HSPRO2 [Impatiens glandulifera]|uniref:nematode resistance protein-like HSPRO2 n=1 Tax=Impatiens glandulifera TaxID=253017 RepID=UPI001FB14EFA|nr:nematode resistance protein-like HSPRO2 [Impatiens glandulifera]
MMDFDRKLNMVTSSDKPIKSPRLSNKFSISIPTIVRLGEVSPATDSACSAYEHYLRLPDLKKLWDCKEFPDWKNESILRPALQALEITFRLVSTVLSDPRPYSNRREWKRKLESLAMNQVELIAMICEDEEEFSDTQGKPPTIGLFSSAGVLSREDSSTEVWKLSSNTTVVSRGSESSLLPRLATWRTAEDIAQNILYSIECEMRRCPYTLGLGEPNLSGKPNLDYDLICKPYNLQSLKKPPSDDFNHENQTVYTTHQILECWIRVSHEILHRVVDRIDSNEFERAANDCWMIERIWKVLEQIEDLHLLMDPNDFLRLKSQLTVKSDSSSSAAFCFRSRSLIDITKKSKNLRHKLPDILGVEVDPLGGPRIQEAAMNLYRKKTKKTEFEKIHLIQSMQAIESAMKRFYYAYKQVLVIMVGSLEAQGNQSFVSEDSLAHIFLEPTYFPSLDAAKTFLGDYWEQGRRNKNSVQIETESTHSFE